MKALSYISLAIFSLIIGFWLGYTNMFGLLEIEKLVESDKEIIGTYKTTTWNNGEASLSLRDDYSCFFSKYGEKCNWKRLDNIINIKIDDRELNGNIVDNGIVINTHFFEKLK